MPQAILIDTDTASDDAVALIMALRSENARVIAITTVAGNVHVHQATRNALYTAELCDANTPVYQGAETPLARNVGRCVIMGGAPCCEGNVTPAAEYNMWVDPEAARMVFHSGLPIEMVGWQLCRGAAVLAPADIEFINKMGTPLADFAVECNSTARKAYCTQTGEDGISLPDPVAMSIALDPSIGYESSQRYVDIEAATELTRGMTVVDRLGVAGDERNRATWAELVDRVPKTKVYWAIDAARWKEALYCALTS